MNPPPININLLDNQEHREAMEIAYRKHVYDELAKIDQKHADNYKYLQEELLAECSKRGLVVTMLVQLPPIENFSQENDPSKGEHYIGTDFYSFSNLADTINWVNGKPDKKSKIDSIIYNCQFVKFFMQWLTTYICPYVSDTPSVLSVLMSTYTVGLHYAKTGTLPDFVLKSIDKKYE